MKLAYLSALLLGMASVAADESPNKPPADPHWTAQGLEDAKQDRTSIPYEGYSPNRMVCDTTLRLGE